MDFDAIELRKALISLAIEKALLKMGKPDYDLVVKELRKYNCQLTDCYNHPEYLKAVLQDIYGNAHRAIINNIKKELGELANQKEYNDFLTVLQ